MDLNFPQAEEAVIGAILIDGEHVLPAVTGELLAEDFSDPTLRHLFEAARDLFLAQKPVDPVTIGAAAGAGEEYGRVASAIMERTPTAANAMEYAAVVRRSARLRAIQSVGFELSQCRDLDDGLARLREAEGMLAGRERVKIARFRDMAENFLARMDDPTPADYLDFGFAALNDKVKISQGRFGVLAAESSVGKTALALQIALGIARGGKRVGFFSLETSAPDAMDRIMAQTTDAPLPAIKGKRLDEAWQRALVREIERSWELPFELIEAAGSTVEDLRAVTLQRRYEVIFVDYVQLLQAEGENPAQQVRSISMDLHRMAQQLGVTVVGLSQVTPPPKDQKGRRAELGKDNLRESHQLIHDAEFILIMDLSDITDYSSTRILKVDKNKDGPCCRMLLRFDARHMRFEYQPPVEDPDAAASRERTEVMDCHREERAEKRAREKAQRDAQESAFAELEGGKEGLPF